MGRFPAEAIKARTRYPVINGRKTCAVCGINKSIDEFYFSNKSKGYRRQNCKKCQSEHCCRNQNEARIINLPQSYWECGNEACNWINPVERKKCFKCNIEK